MRVHNGTGADRSQHFGHRFAANLLLSRDGLESAEERGRQGEPRCRRERPDGASARFTFLCYCVRRSRETCT
jgi:hypothetical protein